MKVPKTKSIKMFQNQMCHKIKSVPKSTLVVWFHINSQLWPKYNDLR